MTIICTEAGLADIRNGGGSCEYKCSLQLKYPDLSTLSFSIESDSTNIKFTPHDSTPSATYNGTSYSLDQVRIFIKSCHNFNGSPVQGELVLKHNEAAGESGEKNTLFICVPIIEGSGQSILDDLLLRSKNIGGGGSVPFTTSFATFIPRKTYYNYKSNPLFGTETLCGDEEYKDKANYVVFDKIHALTINKDSIDYLTTNSNNTYSGTLDAHPAKEVFKSVSPPGDVGLEDIYIDCQPVGASGKTPEQEFVPKEEGLPTFFVDNKFVPIIVGMILMYYSYRLISYLMCKASIPLFDANAGARSSSVDSCKNLLFGLPFT